MLDRLRIVLISPSGPANVGAVARAMANMGLHDLVIVAPRCDPQDEAAVAYSAHGRAVLDGARVVPTLREAVADCVRTYATSSKLGLYRRQAAITPAEASDEAGRLVAAGPVAFVFGREDYGLQNRELLEFDRVVTIPADEQYPVMNLAAAVAVMCYELRQVWIRHAAQPPLPMAIEQPLAPDGRKQILFDKLFDALERIGFFDFKPKQDHLKYALRHLFGRMELGVNEADILIGMAQQIRWYADHHPDRVDPEG